MFEKVYYIFCLQFIYLLANVEFMTPIVCIVKMCTCNSTLLLAFMHYAGIWEVTHFFFCLIVLYGWSDVFICVSKLHCVYLSRLHWHLCKVTLKRNENKNLDMRKNRKDIWVNDYAFDRSLERWEKLLCYSEKSNREIFGKWKCSDLLSIFKKRKEKSKSFLFLLLLF